MMFIETQINPCDSYVWMQELVFDQEATQHALIFLKKYPGYVSSKQTTYEDYQDYHSRTTTKSMCMFIEGSYNGQVMLLGYPISVFPERC